jgi:alkanesulfonate monooxygenase SsuD/methylene tetrahydromethanopterin reductase-like flavin-dependent oxidoreductase (luciferase family)
MNARIPIYLGTGIESTVRLTGEIADGWLPLGFVPGSLPEYLPWLEQGFARAGNGKSLRDIEIMAGCHVRVDSDVKAAIAALKPETALYVGGMGARSKNFHKTLMSRRGFADAAERVQELYLAGRKEEAAAAVPDEWIDQKSLLGPRARIIERYRAWADSGATLLGVRTQQDEAVEVMAEAARKYG